MGSQGAAVIVCSGSILLHMVFRIILAMTVDDVNNSGHRSPTGSRQTRQRKPMGLSEADMEIEMAADNAIYRDDSDEDDERVVGSTKSSYRDEIDDDIVSGSVEAV